MAPSEDILDRVVGSNLCSGCGACQAVAGPESVRMRFATDGFLRPEILREPSSRQLKIIRDICPGARVRYDALDGAGDFNDIWGPIVRTRVGFSGDERVRHDAASGGGLTALLLHLLDAGAVDAIAQVGADPGHPAHCLARISRTREEVIGCAASRYAPSDPAALVGEVLSGDETVAFVGKPCDVSAVRRLARHDPRVSAKIPYLVSFFCAGVPSMNGTRALVEALDSSMDEIVELRYRGEGWPGQAKVVRRDGGVSRMGYHASWGKILVQYLQFRCKVCPDGIGDFADVVAADLWDCDENGYPTFDEAPGRSLIISRTHRGEEITEAAIASGHLKVTNEEPALERIRQSQPFQFERRTTLLAQFLAIRLALRFSPEFAGPVLWRASRSQSWIALLRTFKRTLTRAIRVRRAGPAQDIRESNAGAGRHRSPSIDPAGSKPQHRE